MSVETTEFGRTADGSTVRLFTCRNSDGMVLELTDFGAIIVSVRTPDSNDTVEEITLGFRSLQQYLSGHPYFGATVGRYCNRIGGAAFEMDGKRYRLAANNGANHLHGGLVGFDKVLWDAQVVETEGSSGVRFSRTSPDGEEGYPGNLSVEALYLLTQANELHMEFTATTDRTTPVNLTNHAYWNLAGAASGPVLEHEIMIEADHYLPVDDNLIPTGEIAPVRGTPLDFRTPARIGARIEEIGAVGGYDHCYVLRNQSGELALAARVRDPQSGRIMEVLTTQPGLQFYTGNFLDGSERSGGAGRHGAFCLETQHYPDSPNQDHFPSVWLSPGQEYRQVTVHRFLVE